MELDPDNGLAVAGLGLLRYHQGDVDEAEEYYQRAIDLIPNAYQPYVWYSTLLARQQRFEEAFEKSQKAHEIAPK
jgi:tetratricopeptide (TPR) repeat protein